MQIEPQYKGDGTSLVVGEALKTLPTVLRSSIFFWGVLAFWEISRWMFPCQISSWLNGVIGVGSAENASLNGDTGAEVAVLERSPEDTPLLSLSVSKDGVAANLGVP